MATFASPKTGMPGITAWEYYVEGKADWERFKHACKTECETTLRDNDGSELATIGIGIDIELLSNVSKTFETRSKAVRSKVHAYIRAGDQTGWAPIKCIRKPTRDTTADENAALKKLDNDIRSVGKPLHLRIRNCLGSFAFTFAGIVGAETISGTPKADFALVNESKMECYISHKKGGGFRAYQQYASITGGYQDPVNGDPFVRAALAKFADNHQNIEVNRIRYQVPCPVGYGNDLLLNRAIYGPDYGYEYGINNVHFIAQGTPYISETKGGYELGFSEGLSINGDLSHFNQFGYSPTIFARYQAGRKFYSDDRTYNNVRVLIGPQALATTARVI